MTTYQTQLFNQILDVNWDISTANVSQVSKDAMITRLNELTTELAEHMGEEAYHSFMLNGKKMFATKEDNDEQLQWEYMNGEYPDEE